MSRSWLKILLPLVVVAAGAGFAALIVAARPDVEVTESEPELPLVRVMKVEVGDVVLDVASTGTVLPRTEATLVAEVAGRIVWVAPAFASGGFFESGEILVRLDARDYELAVTRARSEVSRAEVGVAREEAEAAVALSEWRALGRGGEPPALVARAPQTAEARAVLAAARASLAQAELQLDRTTVRAPFAGRVREKVADLGQYVSPAQPLARIYAADYAEVRLPVADDQLAFLDMPFAYRGVGADGRGPAVRLRATFAGGTHEWAGRLVRTAGEIDPTTRTLALIARVENPYAQTGGKPPLAIGMFVEARIAGRRIHNLAVLPRAALHDGRAPRLLVLDGDRLRFRDVSVTRRQGEYVIVSGLEPGTPVCVSPLETPVDGMRVRTTVEAPLTPAVLAESRR